MLALYHAAEAGHAVLEVHDVVARLHVVEKGRHRAARGRATRWGRRRPVRSPSASTASLSAGYMKPRSMGAATTCTPGPELAHHRGAEALVAQMTGTAGRAGRRSRRTRRPCSAWRCRSRSWAISRSVPAATGSHPVVAIDRGARPLGRRREHGHGGVGAAQEAVERQVETGEIPALRPPRSRPGRRPGRLPPRRSPRPVRACAAGLDQQHLGASGSRSTSRCPVGGEPRQPRLHAVEAEPLGQPLPGLAPPRLLVAQRGRPLADLGRGQQFPAAENDRPRRGRPRNAGRRRRTRSAGPPRRPTGRCAPGGRRRGEDVDDRAPHRQLAPVLDLVLPAVAEADQLAPPRSQVDLLPLGHLDGLDVLDVRARGAGAGPGPGTL